MAKTRNNAKDAVPHLSSSVTACDVADAWWNDEVARTLGNAALCLQGQVSDADLGKRVLDTVLRTVLGAAKELRLRRFIENSQKAVEALFLQGSKLVVLASGRGTWFELTIWGTDRALAESLRERILAAVPRSKPVARQDLVPFAFWRSQRHEDVVYTLKNVVCPSFDEIADNYVAGVRARIEELVRHPKPDEHGKIILWFGPAGTGKTHAVRALAREWVSRIGATAEVVLDPEAMFGSATRMHSIVLSEGSDDDAVHTLRRRAGRVPHGGEDGDEPTSDDAPLRLIIIEDAAELFSTGCRHTQGFARFLNVTDGIVGQGLRCVFLLTANEEIGRIDQALVRPGRCLQTIEFEPFEAGEGREWLARRGGDPGRVRDVATLAELYALREAREKPAVVAERVGF